MGHEPPTIRVVARRATKIAKRAYRNHIVELVHDFQNTGRSLFAKKNSLNVVKRVWSMKTYFVSLTQQENLLMHFEVAHERSDIVYFSIFPEG